MNPPTQSSYFEGGVLGWIGISILAFLLSFLTLGFGTPWAVCMVLRWFAKHTVIDGRRLQFNGSGAALFVKYIVWWLLTIITFGIFGFFMIISVVKWVTARLSFEE